MPVWRARHQTHNTKNRRVPTLHTDNGGKGTFCLQNVKTGKMQKKRRLQPIQKTHKVIGHCAN